MNNKTFIKKKVSIIDAYKVSIETLKTGSIDSVIKGIFDLLNLPVLLVDEKYQIISAFPKRRIGVDIYDSYIDHNFLGNVTLDKYEHIQKEYNYKQVFYLKKGLEKCPRIFSEITEFSAIYGHLSIYAFDNEITENDIEIVRIMSDALKIVLSRRQKPNEGHIYAKFLDELLDPSSTISNREFAARNIANRISGHYAIMVIHVFGFSSRRALVESTIAQLEENYRYIIATIRKESIVIFLGLMNNEDLNTKMNFLRNVFNDLDLRDTIAGVSQVFENTMEMRDRYIQAHATAFLGNKDITFYDEVAPNQLFQIVARTLDINIMIDPIIHDIIKYDQDNSTEYYITLKEYTLNMHSKNKTSSKLCIHRNTLLYRLNKIEEIFGLNLEDPKRYLSLIDSFQILSLKENFSKNKLLNT
ncbi:MAG: helix-turn-helix domain-containing protein [Gammaproteobacteria bacterium]|nr:helix-turn-helix domain-containing protein [Gammaproteobacteria bacterium]